MQCSRSLPGGALVVPPHFGVLPGATGGQTMKPRYMCDGCGTKIEPRIEQSEAGFTVIAPCECPRDTTFNVPGVTCFSMKDARATVAQGGYINDMPYPNRTASLMQ